MTSVLDDLTVVELKALAEAEAIELDSDLVEEGDARLRRRVQLAPEAFSVAGPEGAYVYHGLKVAPWARDASATMTRPGKVKVTMLRAGNNPAPSRDEREEVRLALANNDLRPLTDMVEVAAPGIARTDIKAKLTLYPGPDGAVVQARALKAVTTWVDANRMLGMNLRRSALFSKLHQEGVHSVDLIEPAQDIVLDATQVYAIGTISVSVEALRDA